MEDKAPIPEGARVAIVGAGPAGALLAIALLDAARARRTPVQVLLFHAGRSRRRRIAIDNSAVAQLAAAGIPLPAAGVAPLQGTRAAFGRACAERPGQLHAAVCGSGDGDDFAAWLRAVAVQKGAVLHHRAVESICAAGAAGYTVRAAGASLRVETVVLACGAAAPIAARVPGHRPPPIWRGCAAEVEVDPAAGPLAPWATTIRGAAGIDVHLLPGDCDDQVLGVGPDVGPADLAEALLAAVGNGVLPPVRLRDPRRVFLPAGVARPALPAIGDALGGAPDGHRLAEAARQAQLLAAAWLDGGPDAMLEAARAASVRMEGRIRRSIRRARRWRRRREATVELAVRREARRPPGDRPVADLLLRGAASPDVAGATPLRTLRALLALLVAWLLILWRAALGGATPPPRNRSERVFVVDDDEEVAEQLCAFLADRGVECVPFGDGMSAVAAAARERPAAVVLDVALPWLDGPSVCRVLRRREPIPVFVATALPLSMARAEAEAAGATAVLAKPIDPHELGMRLQAYVPVRQRRQQAPPPRPPREDAARPPAG